MSNNTSDNFILALLKCQETKLYTHIFAPKFYSKYILLNILKAKESSIMLTEILWPYKTSNKLLKTTYSVTVNVVLFDTPVPSIAVALITVVPLLRALIIPFESTVATFGLELEYFTIL